MKHKEAIEIIKKLRDGLYKLKEYGAERYLIEVSVDYYKKFEEAVSVLEQEPCEGCDYKEWLKGEVEPQESEDKE